MKGTDDMLNKVSITINSRIYTVVANEDAEYLKSLCDYVNEKVNLVINEGNHVTADKPIVLAALNICDEYFKLLNREGGNTDISELITENKRLEAEIRDMKKAEQESSDKAREIEEELEITRRVLQETEEKIKLLNEQIKEKEDKIKKQRSDFAIKEKELLDMIDSKKI